MERVHGGRWEPGWRRWTWHQGVNPGEVVRRIGVVMEDRRKWRIHAAGTHVGFVYSLSLSTRQSVHVNRTPTSYNWNEIYQLKLNTDIEANSSSRIQRKTTSSFISYKELNSSASVIRVRAVTCIGRNCSEYVVFREEAAILTSRHCSEHQDAASPPATANTTRDATTLISTIQRWWRISGFSLQRRRLLLLRLKHFFVVDENRITACYVSVFSFMLYTLHLWSYKERMGARSKSSQITLKELQRIRGYF